MLIGVSGGLKQTMVALGGSELPSRPYLSVVSCRPTSHLGRQLLEAWNGPNDELSKQLLSPLALSSHIVPLRDTRMWCDKQVFSLSYDISVSMLRSTVALAWEKCYRTSGWMTVGTVIC